MTPGKKYAVFYSESAVAAAWSADYRSLSEKKEYGALIYSTAEDDCKIYYTGKTYAGMGKIGIIRPNVAIPFVFVYTVQAFIERIRRKASPEAFIHTHPKPDAGYTYRYHSKEDMFLLRLPGIKGVYVIPYENNEINRQPDTDKI
ncbi:MAG: hypothetical protein PHZ09_03660 [Eubacteriales bacterium]|jgi:hypothetical protein|nr:hypothetical protein [Eubacteriales bacterium]